MQPIESELHQLLLETFPGINDTDLQMQVVAEATANLQSEYRFRKTASSTLNIDDDTMSSALLEAMERISQVSAFYDDETEEVHLDASGLSPEEVVRAASRLNGKGWGEYMSIVNDDDLDAILGEVDTDPFRYDLSDGTDRNDRFTLKGHKKHRTNASGR